MTNREFGEKLEKRTKMFSISVIKLSSSLPNSPEARVIRNQLTKSATSIGANYREANRSRSNNDFKNKIKISESEANETLYWLEIIEELEWIDVIEIKAIIKESTELLAILTTISNKMKTKVN